MAHYIARPGTKSRTYCWLFRYEKRRFQDDRASQGSCDQATLLSFVQEAVTQIPVFRVRNRQPGTKHDLSEAPADLIFFNNSFCLQFKRVEFKIGVKRHPGKSADVTACNGRDEEMLRSPLACPAIKFRGGR